MNKKYIEVVIKISENDYWWIKQASKGNTSYPATLRMYDAIKNGTPLPEGCGDLIDRTELLKAMDTWPKFGYTIDERLTFPCDPHLVPYVHYDNMVQAIKGMSAIIKADKEEV